MNVFIVGSEKGIEDNFATNKHGATTIAGENQAALLNGNFTDYGFNRGRTIPIVFWQISKLFSDVC